MQASRTQIRQSMRQQRVALQGRDRQKLEASFTEQALDWFKTYSTQEKPVIAVYAAMNGELSLSALSGALHQQGYPLCLPCMSDKTRILTFRQWRPDDVLVNHPIYHLSEPLPDKPALTPQCLLVPLVAFDSYGNRLGYGGGYYDATLSHLRQINAQTFAIGCAFAFQQIPALETEPHDQSLDSIITDKGVIIPTSYSHSF